MSTGRLLRRKAASEYLREHHGVERAPSTLAKLAVTGGGPVFRHIDRIPVYSPADLDEWVASKLSAPMRSTLEALPAKSGAVANDAQMNSNATTTARDTPPADKRRRAS